MPIHDLEVHLPPQEIVNTDLVITVRSDGEKLGELRVSRGTVDWAPANHIYAFSLPWERFDQVMRGNGKRA